MSSQEGITSHTRPADVLTASSRTRLRGGLLHPQLSIWEWLILVLFALSSFGVFALNAVDAAANHRVFSGADGLFPYDQLQYLAWATDAGHHVLISNLFAFHLGSHIFLDPLWLLTGVLHVQVGLSYEVLIGVWKLIAVLCLFLAVRAYARSHLGTHTGGAVVALAVALFMLPASFLVANRLGLHNASLVLNEIIPFNWISGDFPIALAVAAMVVFLFQVNVLLTSEAADQRRRAVWLASGAGLAASWLHPWQGVTVLVIVGVLVLWERPSWRRHRRLAIPILLTLAPILYYAVLPALDVGWKQSQKAGADGLYGAALGAALVTLLPVMLLMAPGYLQSDKSPANRMLRIWPFAAAIVFVVMPTDKFHAIGGFSIPAAILMVRAWRWLPSMSHRWLRSGLAAAAVAFVIVGAPFEVADRMVHYRIATRNDAQLPDDDARALAFVASQPSDLGVLTTDNVGGWVPELTDHPTWVGHPIWTPSLNARSAQVGALFGGAMDQAPARERDFVLSTGAAFVLEPCGSSASLARALLPAGFTVRQFGCAKLYERG
jgi:hypothetical protein